VRDFFRSRPAVAMVVLVGFLVLATAVGLLLLWPTGPIRHRAGVVTVKTFGAKVESLGSSSCGVQVAGAARCQRVTARLLDGPDRGRTTTFDFARTTGYVSLHPGDRIRLYRNLPPPGETVVESHVPRYSFADYDRRAPMLWLAIGFGVVLLLVCRLAGARALVGLAASLFVLFKFVIPAILQGHSPFAVALVGSFAVMLVTIPLCYGLGAKAIAAWLGTGLSLLLTVGLASLFTDLTRLSGSASEESVFLSASAEHVSLRGLLLAGMVIGALGVLVDLTVSQASTVMALQRANPELGFRALFRHAVDVGNDHIGATVNTLVFAYAGASLPLLLILSIGGTSMTDAVNSESVAEQIVATLVGSIGLVASMPITTALAAVLARHVPQRVLEGDAVHVH
jgi:uncharacterized membrane protein